MHTYTHTQNTHSDDRILLTPVRAAYIYMYTYIHTNIHTYIQTPNTLSDENHILLIAACTAYIPITHSYIQTPITKACYHDSRVLLIAACAMIEASCRTLHTHTHTHTHIYTHTYIYQILAQVTHVFFSWPPVL